MIVLCCEHLSVWCIWLYVVIMSRTCFRANQHLIATWMAIMFFNDWAMLWVLICTMHLTICYYYVTYAFQSESTLYSSDTGRKLNAPKTFRRRSGRPLNVLRSIYALCLRGIIVWISWNSLLKTDAMSEV